jgi:hypothetical protein
MVELHQDNHIAILNIAKGLATTIQRREEQNTAATLAFMDKISNLEKQLDDYQDRVPLPTRDWPEGYIINNENRVLNFIIPTSNGDHQQAYWVKQLAKGQVAGLPREYVLRQTPFVTEVHVYATLAQGQEEVMGPVHSLLGWLWLLLIGPAVHYGMLLKHIETTGDWGTVGEVL